MPKGKVYKKFIRTYVLQLWRAYGLGARMFALLQYGPSFWNCELYMQLIRATWSLADCPVSFPLRHRFRDRAA